MSGPLVVVGDSLLDVDLAGTASRLSPEAPVPVVDVDHRWARPGGAALTALLGSRSGAEVVLVTAVGTDEPSEELMGLLDGRVDVRRLRLDGQTVCKTRVGAAGVPMLRLDSGHGRACDGGDVDAVLDALTRAGAIVVSDYGRGVAELGLIRPAVAERTGQVPVVWDPHPRGPAPVPGCALVTPNTTEAHELTGREDPAAQGRRLCRDWDARTVAVTMGERGAVLTEAASGRSTLVPVPTEPTAGRVLRMDSCGAGDQFAASAATSLLDGDDALIAVRRAVSEASEFVRAGGVTQISSGTTVTSNAAGVHRPGGDAQDAFALAERVRRGNGRLVATGGCFDLVHRGHVQLLSQARSLGDALVVCLNSDASVRRSKGAGRPVVSQADRARVVRALGCVDAVAIFEEDTPAELLARLRPDIWVKGTDYIERPMPERQTVEQLGGRVVLLPVVPGYSTTRLIGASAAPIHHPQLQETS